MKMTMPLEKKLSEKPPAALANALSKFINFKSHRTHSDLWDASVQALNENEMSEVTPFKTTMSQLSYLPKDFSIGIGYLNQFNGFLHQRSELIILNYLDLSSESTGIITMSPPVEVDNYKPQPLIFRTP